MSQSEPSPLTYYLFITKAMRVDQEDWRKVLLSHLANPGTEMSVNRGIDTLERLFRFIHDRVKSMPQFQWTARFPDLFAMLDRMPDSEFLARILLVVTAPWSQPEYASLFSKPVSLLTSVPEALDYWLESIHVRTPLLFWLMFNWTAESGESFALSLQNSLTKLGSSAVDLSRILYGNDSASVAKGIRKDIPDYCLRDDASMFSNLLQLLLESKLPNVRFRFQEYLSDEFPHAFWPDQLRSEIFPPVKLSAEVSGTVIVKLAGSGCITLGELAKVLCFPTANEKKG
jgi:hypothetical protein